MREINEYFENEQMLQGPAITVTRDGKIRLRLKADPLSGDFGNKYRLPIFITN